MTNGTWGHSLHFDLGSSEAASMSISPTTYAEEGMDSLLMSQSCFPQFPFVEIPPMSSMKLF